MTRTAKTFERGEVVEVRVDPSRLDWIPATYLHADELYPGERPWHQVKIGAFDRARPIPPHPQEDQAMTQVVNIRRDAAIVRQAVKEGRYTYVGRGMGSIWGNPFTWKVGTQAEFLVTKEECLPKYEAWLRQQPHLMARLHELKNRVLGCWCHPSPCHADILARLADETTDQKGP